MIDSLQMLLDKHTPELLILFDVLLLVVLMVTYHKLRLNRQKAELYLELATQSDDRAHKAEELITAIRQQLASIEEERMRHSGYLRHVQDRYSSGLYLYDFGFKPTEQDLKLRKKQLVSTLITEVNEDTELMSHILFGYDNMLRRIQASN